MKIKLIHSNSFFQNRFYVINCTLFSKLENQYSNTIRSSVYRLLYYTKKYVYNIQIDKKLTKLHYKIIHIQLKSKQNTTHLLSVLYHDFRQPLIIGLLINLQ